MRVKSNWFKSGKVKTPQEIAGGMAFIIWRVAENALKNMRKADFDIAADAQYFAFLSESLIFLAQIADRIAYLHLTAEERMAFTTELANRLAENLAENRARLLDGEIAAYKRNFIEVFNVRAGEYAEFDYAEGAPTFSFLRHFGYVMQQVVDERDQTWVTDQIMTVEGPQAVTLIEQGMRGLLELEPTRRRARGSVSGD